MTGRPLFVLAALVTLALSACGRKDDSRAATQVAARVNSKDITIHQINHALARSRGVTPENASEVKREILDRLIDQELAKRQAILKGLDRSPSVILDIEAAKSEILARAYRHSLTEYLPEPAPYDVKTYYRNHPELFAERRLFSLEEVNFAGTDEIAAGVREKLSKVRSLREVAEWLQSRGIAVTASRGIRAAEQIPLEILPKLQQLKQGESRLFEVSGGFRLIRVVAFQSAPIDEAAAASRIRQFLINRSSAEVIANEMKELRSTAKIEYFGELQGRPAPTPGNVTAEGNGVKQPDQSKN